MKALFGLLAVGCFALGGLEVPSYAGEVENTRCQRVVGDPEAQSLFNIHMPGTPPEIVTACGSYQGGDGLGREARGNWFNWYFIRTAESNPEEVIKVYLHHQEPNLYQRNNESVTRFAHASDKNTFKDMLAYTMESITQDPERDAAIGGKFRLSYVDEQNVLRERELTPAELEAD